MKSYKQKMIGREGRREHLAPSEAAINQFFILKNSNYKHQVVTLPLWQKLDLRVSRTLPVYEERLCFTEERLLVNVDRVIAAGKHNFIILTKSLTWTSTINCR